MYGQTENSRRVKVPLVTQARHEFRGALKARTAIVENQRSYASPSLPQRC